MQRPDPLTDPLPLNDQCRHPVVYIETKCCHQDSPKPPPLLPQRSFLPPSLNGHTVPPTQLLPVVKASAAEEPEAAARHRLDDDDDGTDMKDVLLGCLIGAAAAVFVIGLLLMLVFR